MATADTETVKGLIKGAYDMHVHSAPDVLPRRFDDMVMAQHALDAGMAGFVIKNHYAPTAGRAADIRAAVPGVNVFGGLVLNNAVGGLNAIAVDIAGRMGNKVVWMPTVDAANELDNIAGQVDESKLPYWMTIARAMREKGIAGEPISVVDGDGKVTKDTRDCLDLIAEHDMVLATGHVNPHTELEPLIKAATEAGVDRIVVTHPEFPTTYLTADEQIALAKYNVYFERCFTQPYTKKVSWEIVFENIRKVGPASTILSTDLGQSTAPWVEEGIGIFIDKLLGAGFTETEIQMMSHHNSGQMLGVEGS